jgi:putative NADPH-quinone reductase
MTKKILIINGHPDSESFNAALANAYKQGAIRSGAEIRELCLRELTFNLNLEYGYRKRMELEADLLQAQKLILWAEHLVWVFPVWWGSVPALLKGFLDRTFLPGFAYQKREHSLILDGLLKGKTARIISTIDQPVWYYRLVYARPTFHAMKKLTLELCGIKPVRTTLIGPIRLSKDSFRAGWLQCIERLGEKQV